MPLDLECQLIAGLVIREVKHLLKNKRPQDGMQFLGGTAEFLFKKGNKLLTGSLGMIVFWNNPGHVLSSNCRLLGLRNRQGSKRSSCL